MRGFFMSKISQGFFGQTLKATVVSIISMLISVLVFALVVHFAGLNSSIIKIVNQFLKIFSIFLGCFFVIEENGGLIKGLLTGILFSIIITLIFALVSGQSGFTFELVIELLFCGIIGLISGVISVNVKAK